MPLPKAGMPFRFSTQDKTASEFFPAGCAGHASLQQRARRLFTRAWDIQARVEIIGERGGARYRKGVQEVKEIVLFILRRGCGAWTELL